MLYGNEEKTDKENADHSFKIRFDGMHSPDTNLKATSEFLFQYLYSWKQ